MRITEGKMRELINIFFPTWRMYYDIIHDSNDYFCVELKCVGFTNAFFEDGEFPVELYIVDDESVYVNVYATNERLEEMCNNRENIINRIKDAINKWMPYQKLEVLECEHISIHFEV